MIRLLPPSGRQKLFEFSFFQIEGISVVRGRYIDSARAVGQIIDISSRTEKCMTRRMVEHLGCVAVASVLLRHFYAKRRSQDYFIL